MFKDRFDAAHQLTEKLQAYKGREDTIVIAIPRGGLELGIVFAKELHLPLDVVFTKKIGAPSNPEFAIGAVSLDDVIVEPSYDLPELQEYIKREAKRIRVLLKERREKYRGDKPPLDLQGKTVIVTDDGVATGKTMILTLQLLKKLNPKKIIVALPVASPDVIPQLQNYADEVICLLAPPVFFGVGGFYNNFSQVSDEKAITLLHEAEQYL